MTTRPAVPKPRDVHSKDVRRAWISVGLLPVAVVLAFVAGEGLASALGYESGSDELAPLWVAATVGLVAVPIAVAPGALAVWLDLRARRAGDQRGLVPAIVGGVLGIGFIGINLLSYVVGRIAG